MILKLLPLIFLPIWAFSADLKLEKQELQSVGLKVWQNECRGTLDGLISWSASEEFPSLGIGHFIWYPRGSEKTFEEGFPKLVDYLLANEIEVPSWIRSKKGFPWKTREAFLKDKRSKKVMQLRQLLSDTLDLQILFLFERFKEAENKLLPHLTEVQKKHLETLKTTPSGVYALIDYVNFKGTGLSHNERYRGEGWGLLQVLQNLPENPEEITQAFANSAKKVLTKRTHNAPLSRNEKQYLPGWIKRVESYEVR